MPKPPKRKVVAKRSSSAMADAYSQAWRSPFVRDTLGIPEGVGMVARPEGNGPMASYLPFDKTIYANTLRDPQMYPMAGASPADTPSERNILTHELGHAYGKKAFPSLITPLIAPPPTKPMSRKEEDARMMLSEYGQTSPDEALANAYVNATGFLSETAQDTTGFRNKLGAYEGNTPGAGSIVKDLLTAKKVYANHPLRKVIR